VAEKWTYYVPCVLQYDGQIGFKPFVVEVDGPINSPEMVYVLQDQVTARYREQHPEHEQVALVPLGWERLSAQIRNASNNGDGGAGE